MNSLKERLIKFIDYLGIEKSVFERKCNLSNGFVDKAGDNTRTSSLDKISKIFPELNITWLRTGNGKMLLDGETQNEIYERGNVPYEFVQQLFEERKKHDEKEMELLAQNRDLINILKGEISNIEKTLIQAVPGATATCVDASGTDVKK